MRRLHTLIVLLAIVATPVLAQAPADLQPVPDAQPPGLLPLDASIEPQVTIRTREGELVEEHRVNGKLYKIPVRPDNAPPYTLIDHSGEGSFVQQEGPGTPQLSVPMWVIGTF